MKIGNHMIQLIEINQIFMKNKEKKKISISSIITLVLVLLLVIPIIIVVTSFVLTPTTVIKNYNSEETSNILNKEIIINKGWIDKILLSQTFYFTFLWDWWVNIVLKLNKSETSRLVNVAKNVDSKFEHWKNPPIWCNYEDASIKDDNLYLSCLEKHTLKCNLKDENKSFYYYSVENFIMSQWKKFTTWSKSIVIDESDGLLYFCDSNG